MASLGEKALTNVAIPLPALVSSLVSNAINKFERKINGKVIVRAQKNHLLICFK